ncbi:hypothetical protein Q4517_03695 [Tenacibaculum sp. 1_MG-2023]|uniref:hypothetical protein n=1 Tax=Tenacibaculum sp. 1_MG-2023 TaxID=3062653 RepID=UPI0026E372BA|nr:hypothetical protein [Tenacibaculum sp. 1_MG-2023]MDO6674648.1 hypothetical protein [Tenacibaculum sp. 1_MG-2023]
MGRKLLFSLILFCAITPTFSQVKVGNNPSSIHLNSILELESSDKVLVISRMTNAQMNAIQPLRGALVFNTDQNCVFMYDGTTWISLCNGSGNTRETIKVTTSSTPPSDNNIGDFWVNDTLNNTTSIWDGTNWISIDNNPRRGNGIPNTSTAPDPTSGDVYVDTTTGVIYAYNGTTWVASNATLSANNGLFINASNTIQLGGVLIQPTTIETSTANTLAITGLENGSTSTDDIVTVDRTTGVLKRTTASNLLKEEITKITATDGQITFTGLTLYTTDKINVYRNGVRIDFTVDNATTITIEPDATCYAGDEIRIVQLY